MKKSRKERSEIWSSQSFVKHSTRKELVVSVLNMWCGSSSSFFVKGGGGEGKVGENGDASLLTFFSALNVAAPLDEPDEEGDGELCSQPTSGCAPRAWPRAKVG